MADCKYCAWLGHAEPESRSTSWEPLKFICYRQHRVLEGAHDCVDFEREIGGDDDLGDDDYGPED